jgi:NDP-sugar pyrophosphorylase family protein
VRIGRHTKLHAHVRVEGPCDIGDDCVIDRGAEIVNSVVMPGTYVGRGTRLRNTVAFGRWLYRADLDLLQKIEDPLLLEDGPRSHRRRSPQAGAAPASGFRAMFRGLVG